MGAHPVAGKKIGREEQFFTLAIKSAVTRGVTGQMNHLKPVPDFEVIPIVKQTGGREFPKSKQGTTEGLQPTGNQGETPITGTSLVVSGIQWGGGHPSARLFGQLTHMENVVKVTMSDQDPLDRFTAPPSFLQGTPQQSRPPDEPTVDQVDALRITKDIEIQPDRPNLEEIITHGADDGSGIFGDGVW